MEWAHVAPLLLTLALAGAGFLFVRRYGGGAAMAELERAGRILERRVQELEAENKQQAAELTRLRAETNVAIALAPVLEALKLHEERAVLRSDATLRLLEMMASRLGPEVDAA